MLYEVITDVSEQQRLMNEKDQYFSAFQTTPQPILITDPEGTVTSVNDAFVAMYGYAREEILGKNPRILNPGREVYENLGVSVFEYEKRFSELWSSVRDPAKKSWRGELINRRRNGSLICVITSYSIHYTKLYDTGGADTASATRPVPTLPKTGFSAIYSTAAPSALPWEKETKCSPSKRRALSSRIIPRQSISALKAPERSQRWKRDSGLSARIAVIYTIPSAAIRPTEYRRERPSRIVITSYSIHYTKLYDHAQIRRHHQPRDREAPGRHVRRHASLPRQPEGRLDGRGRLRADRRCAVQRDRRRRVPSYNFV